MNHDTNIQSAKLGFNKFCGPAVLSILTGLDTDECAKAIGKVTGRYEVRGVFTLDLLKAAHSLGFETEVVEPGRSIFSSIISLAKRNGMYIFTLEKHFVVIEVNDNGVFLCDNHTKDPISAASSARLGQKVVYIHKVTAKTFKPKPIPKLIRTQLDITSSWNGVNNSKHITITRNHEFDMDEYNKTETLADFILDSTEELSQLIGALVAARARTM